MSKVIKSESSFYRFLLRIPDILKLNLLWIVCSIPVITIGASTTAVYYVNLKMIKNEEVDLVQSFFKSFKENLIQSMILWLIYLVIGGALVADYYYLFHTAQNPSIIIKGITVIATVLYLFCFLYAFPLLARYQNTTGRIILNSFVISIRYIYRTVVIAALTAALILFGFLSKITLVLAVVIGLGVVTYIITSFILKIFDNIELVQSQLREEQLKANESEEDEMVEIAEQDSPEKNEEKNEIEDSKTISQ